jgi:hypothetical protein
MRRQDLFCDRLKTFLISLLDTCDWGESFDKSTVLVLNTVDSVLTDLVDKSYRVHGGSCLEKDHYWVSIRFLANDDRKNPLRH